MTKTENVQLNKIYNSNIFQLKEYNNLQPINRRINSKSFNFNFPEITKFEEYSNNLKDTFHNSINCNSNIILSTYNSIDSSSINDFDIKRYFQFFDINNIPNDYKPYFDSFQYLFPSSLIDFKYKYYHSSCNNSKNNENSQDILITKYENRDKIIYERYIDVLIYKEISKNVLVNKNEFLSKIYHNIYLFRNLFLSCRYIGSLVNKHPYEIYILYYKDEKQNQFNFNHQTKESLIQPLNSDSNIYIDDNMFDINNPKSVLSLFNLFINVINTYNITIVKYSKKEDKLTNKYIFYPDPQPILYTNYPNKLSSFIIWFGNCLQYINTNKLVDVNNKESLFDKIYPNKNGLPLVSTNGKYAIKLFSHGKYYFVEIDDRFPFDEDLNILFPKTNIINQSNSSFGCSVQNTEADNKIIIELWPFLILKALIKFNNDKITSVQCKCKYHKNKDDKSIKKIMETYDTSIFYFIFGYIDISLGLTNIQKKLNLSAYERNEDELIDILKIQLNKKNKSYLFFINMIEEIDNEKEDQVIDNNYELDLSLFKNKNHQILMKNILKSENLNHIIESKFDTLDNINHEGSDIYNKIRIYRLIRIMLYYSIFSVEDFYNNDNFNMHNLYPIDYTEINRKLNLVKKNYKILNKEQKIEYINQILKIKKEIEIEKNKLLTFLNENSKDNKSFIKLNSNTKYFFNNYYGSFEEVINELIKEGFIFNRLEHTIIIDKIKYFLTDLEKSKHCNYYNNFQIEMAKFCNYNKLKFPPILYYDEYLFNFYCNRYKIIEHSIKNQEEQIPSYYLNLLSSKMKKNDEDTSVSKTTSKKENMELNFFKKMKSKKIKPKEKKENILYSKEEFLMKENISWSKEAYDILVSDKSKYQNLNFDSIFNQNYGILNNSEWYNLEKIKEVFTDVKILINSELYAKKLIINNENLLKYHILSIENKNESNILLKDNKLKDNKFKKAKEKDIQIDNYKDDSNNTLLNKEDERSFIIIFDSYDCEFQTNIKKNIVENNKNTNKKIIIKKQNKLSLLCEDENEKNISLLNKNNQDLKFENCEYSSSNLLNNISLTIFNKSTNKKEEIILKGNYDTFYYKYNKSDEIYIIPNIILCPRGFQLSFYSDQEINYKLYDNYIETVEKYFKYSYSLNLNNLIVNTVNLLGKFEIDLNLKEKVDNINFIMILKNEDENIEAFLSEINDENKQINICNSQTLLNRKMVKLNVNKIYILTFILDPISNEHLDKNETDINNIYIKESILSIDLYFSKELENKPKIINKITPFEIKDIYRINKKNFILNDLLFLSSLNNTKFIDICVKIQLFKQDNSKSKVEYDNFLNEKMKKNNIQTSPMSSIEEFNNIKVKLKLKIVNLVTNFIIFECEFENELIIYNLRLPIIIEDKLIEQEMITKFLSKIDEIIDKKDLKDIKKKDIINYPYNIILQIVGISSDKNINKYNKLKENFDMYKYFKTYFTKITKTNTTNKINIKYADSLKTKSLESSFMKKSKYKSSKVLSSINSHLKINNFSFFSLNMKKKEKEIFERKLTEENNNEIKIDFTNDDKIICIMKIFSSDNIALCHNNLKENLEKWLINSWETNEPGRYSKSKYSRKAYKNMIYYSSLKPNPISIDKYLNIYDNGVKKIEDENFQRNAIKTNIKYLKIKYDLSFNNEILLQTKLRERKRYLSEFEFSKNNLDKKDNTLNIDKIKDNINNENQIPPLIDKKNHLYSQSKYFNNYKKINEKKYVKRDYREYLLAANKVKLEINNNKERKISMQLEDKKRIILNNFNKSIYNTKNYFMSELYSENKDNNALVNERNDYKNQSMIFFNKRNNLN